MNWRRNTSSSNQPLWCVNQLIIFCFSLLNLINLRPRPLRPSSPRPLTISSTAWTTCLPLRLRAPVRTSVFHYMHQLSFWNSYWPSSGRVCFEHLLSLFPRCETEKKRNIYNFICSPPGSAFWSAAAAAGGGPVGRLLLRIGRPSWGSHREGSFINLNLNFQKWNSII